MVVFATTGSESPAAAEEVANYPRAPGRSAELVFAFVYTGVRAMGEAARRALRSHENRLVLV